MSTNLSTTSNETRTRLSGHWLMTARLLWLTLTLLSLALYLAGIPAFYQQLQLPCVGGSCSFYGALISQELMKLQTIGFPAQQYATFMIVFLTAIMFIWSGIGFTIFWRRYDDWLALLAAYFLITFNITYPGTPAYAFVMMHPHFAILSLVVNFFGQVSLIFFFALFPDGRLIPNWIRLILLLGIIQTAASLFPSTSPFNENHWPVWFDTVVSLASYGAVIVAQIYRYRVVSTPAQRQQTKWVVFGVSFVLVCFIVLTLLFQIVFPQFNQPNTLEYLAPLLAYPLIFLVFPMSVGIAILRSRLWDIDLIINRTLVYGALTASVVVLYILVVGYLGALFHAGNNLLVSLIATGLVAVLFQPWHGWLQRGVNRLMYGQRDEPYTVVARLGRRLEGTLVPEALLPTIVETVAQALKLPYAAIALKQGDDFQPAAVYGSPVETSLTLPLNYQTELIGQLVLGSRQRGEAFTLTDRQLLEDLARQVGIVAHAVRLTDDLKRSREHLVTTREEERRRLRRDLHDGLGSMLTSLMFKLDATDTLLDSDPQAARALLADVRGQMQASIADIRRLVYNLRPPTLDEWGLVAALREQIAMFSLGDLHVSLEAPEALPPLPAAVEVAAYRLVLEALANVVKHAQATACNIQMKLLPDVLIIEVRDNGAGRPEGAHIGIGTSAMRERAAELGGTCVIEDVVPHGTHVCARIPLRKA
jgi:signal transduction histidine kinase